MLAALATFSSLPTFPAPSHPCHFGHPCNFCHASHPCHPSYSSHHSHSSHPCHPCCPSHPTPFAPFPPFPSPFPTLPGTRQADAAILSALPPLASLTSLRLSRCPGISNATLVTLASSCPLLEDLDLSLAGSKGSGSSAITDAGVAALGALTRLRALRIDGCGAVTADGIRGLLLATPAAGAPFAAPAASYSSASSSSSQPSPSRLLAASLHLPPASWPASASQSATTAAAAQQLLLPLPPLIPAAQRQPHRQADPNPDHVPSPRKTPTLTVRQPRPPPLELLSCAGCTGLSDSALTVIGELLAPTLRVLRLDGCPQITNRGLRRLVGLSELRELSLRGTLVQPQGPAWRALSWRVQRLACDPQAGIHFVGLE